MANPILAAIFGGLQGGLQGHGLDVQRQERKDAARIALEERARKRLMDRITMANAGVHEGTVPTEGTPDALPGISRVPAPDGTQDPLTKLSPLQKDRRMQEMTDEDFGAPSGKAPVAPAYNPANVAARSPAPGRGASSRTPSRYVQLDQGHFMDREDTPEARARQRLLDAYTRAGMTEEQAGAAAVNPGLADNFLFPKKDAENDPTRWTVQTFADGVFHVNPVTHERVRLGDAPPRANADGTAKEGQPSEAERKAYFFYQRAQPAAKIIETFSSQKALDALSAKAGMLGNWTKTDDGRRLIQAGKVWAMAVLRQDSGGAITDAEMEFYFDTYLPRPGDDDATLAQKAEARRVVTEGLLTVGGRAVPKPNAPLPQVGGAKQYSPNNPYAPR